MKKSQTAAFYLTDLGAPPSEIARLMKVTHQKVMEHLYRELGEGLIRRSDIVFSINEKTRIAVEEIVNRDPRHWNALAPKYAERELRRLLRTDVEDGCVYFRLRDARVPLGDMYEYLARIEVFLHDFIKQKLIEAYGNEGWWEQGIPGPIREKCEKTMKEAPEPAMEAYCYTTFIHLKEILSKRWDMFSPCLPQKVASDKKGFLSELGALNGIRNAVMHPCKGIHPSEPDFIKVRALVNELGLLQTAQLRDGFDRLRAVSEGKPIELGLNH